MMTNMTWENVGALFAFLVAVYAFASKYMPPSWAKEAEIAKAKSQGSMSVDDVMRIMRENNKEILTQIMAVIKEGFTRMESTDEKIAEAIRQQVGAMTEMGYKFQSREQVTVSMHKEGHAHMQRIEEQQKTYIQGQHQIAALVSDIAKDIRGNHGRQS